MLEDYRVPLAVTTAALLGLAACCCHALRAGTIEGATPQRALSSRTTRRRGQQLLAGALTGVVVLAVTRWVVLAVVLGALVAFWDRVFGGARHERAAIARIEGTRRLDRGPA